MRLGLLAVVLTLGLVSGTATADPPGEWADLIVLNVNVASYCTDTTPYDGTNCGGWLKVFKVKVLP